MTMPPSPISESRRWLPWPREAAGKPATELVLIFQKTMMPPLALPEAALSMKFPPDQPVFDRGKVRSCREWQFLGRKNCRPLRIQRFQRGETIVHSGAAILRLPKIGLEEVNDNFGENELDFDAMDPIWSQDQTDKHAVIGVSATALGTFPTLRPSVTGYPYA